MIPRTIYLRRKLFITELWQGNANMILEVFVHVTEREVNGSKYARRE